MTPQHPTPEYLERCRVAMAAEQTKSLAETNNWSHVDKHQVHLDWDALYKELAPLLDGAQPSSSEIQTLIARHYSIASRFYPPSREAYIGMALFYQDNPDMKTFHNAYHPKMVDFLNEAIFTYAQNQL
ncbi:TipAS antibiotic-recognition domain-containing protein [Undibacterium curvum]|uniref:TipAS antibiotic-recognition domain-containing protein n=1 Tax=Undibacterium curvum TaxID=2762294 RepID=A0ABR7A448_9BURK|nr:TipAS antibiotic-recognition domain-containing protein [Undibacterium curvum]MBC3931695.1 TipAS antibiotic-recognition domain-containing protein [Undibacterium curvum]